MKRELVMSLDFVTIIIVFSVLFMAGMLFKILDRLGSIERTWASSAIKRIEILEDRISALEQSQRNQTNN